MLVLAMLVCLSVGCVERTIKITSSPQGALVYLNDQEVGRTPLVVPFTYYGVYDVRLERDGYEPMWTYERAAAPWWEYPGPDLIAEAIPDAESQLNWHFFMVPAQPSADVDPDQLVERARALQKQIDQPLEDAAEYQPPSANPTIAGQEEQSASDAAQDLENAERREAEQNLSPDLDGEPIDLESDSPRQEGMP